MVRIGQPGLGAITGFTEALGRRCAVTAVPQDSPLLQAIRGEYSVNMRHDRVGCWRVFMDGVTHRERW